MPTAHGAGAKYAYLDHDTDVVNEAPPILNQWYTVFDAEDVRLLWCTVIQTNNEYTAKNVEIRWTIDGNVYFWTAALVSHDENYVYRTQTPSTGGTNGLYIQLPEMNAAAHVDKRGHSFKVEVRITSALGTNQGLICYCARETLEQT